MSHNANRLNSLMNNKTYLNFNYLFNSNKIIKINDKLKQIVHHKTKNLNVFF